MANRWGNNGNGEWLYFWGAPKSLQWWLQPWYLKMLAPWKKSYDQPRQHIRKQRHYFATKVCPVKAMVFLVVMYGCECWTIKKAERWRSVFELWCWRRLLRVPWTARSNLSILKVISPEYSLEGPTLKLRYFGHLQRDRKSQLIWKDPDAGKDWRQEEKGMTGDEMVGWHHWLLDVSFSKLRELVKHKEAWCAAAHGVTKSRSLLSDEVNWEDQFITSSVDQFEEANYYTIRFLLRNSFLWDKIAKVVINIKKLRYNLHTMKFILSNCSVIF